MIARYVVGKTEPPASDHYKQCCASCGRWVYFVPNTEVHIAIFTGAHIVCPACAAVIEESGQVPIVPAASR